MNLSKKFISYISKYKFEIAAIVICIIFSAAGILVSLHRFWQYEESFIDFGQYDQAIWKISQFQEPIIYHFIHGRINVLGDHFTPSVFLISPIYWFTERSEAILIIQSLVVSLSGLFLFDIGRIVLKNKFLSLSILISYFLFVGLQNAVITEFHELTLMTLPFMITFWALVRDKIKFFFLFLLITLGFKEITFSLGIGLGVAIFFIKKEWRRIGIATILISVLWGFLSLKIFIPHFNHGDYLYSSTIPSGIIPKINSLFDEPEKRHTLFFSFYSFLFLPIFSPEFWLMIVQDYAARFLPEGFVTRWGLGLHYNAQSALILSLASIYGLKKILNNKSLAKYSFLIAIIIILNSVFIFRFVLHGPFLLALNSGFYEHTKEFKFLNEMVNIVPKNASIMTQNNLATRFTHQDVRLIKFSYEEGNPQYIMLDIRDGQSPNNYFGSDDLTKILIKVKNDENYILVYSTKDQYLFKHK